MPTLPLPPHQSQREIPGRIHFSYEMPRKPRFAPPGYPLHITQRGNYRQQVFFTDRDRQHFLDLLDHHAHDVLIHGYALMTNHIHLVATPQADDAASRFMQNLTGQYAHYLHGRLHRRGRLWQSRFYSCVLDQDHLFTALAYVDLNPQRARIVPHATDYPWSSAAAHCAHQPAPEWLHQEEIRHRYSPASWEARLHQPVPRADLAALRRATQLETPLGPSVFIQSLESQFNICFTPRPAGRPPRNPAETQKAFQASR